MNNPGLFNLGDATITNAVTNYVITLAPDEQGVNQAYVDGLDGMLAATFQGNFNGGNDLGTSCKLDLYVTLDQGMTWWQVARLAFGNASAEKAVNLSGLTPKTTAVVPPTLADDSCLDGIFGGRWRAQITTVGVFGGNASISARLNAR